MLDAPSDSELEAGPAKKVETGPPPQPPLLKQPLPPGLVRRGPVSAGAQAQGVPGPQVAKDAAVMWLKGLGEAAAETHQDPGTPEDQAGLPGLQQ